MLSEGASGRVVQAVRDDTGERVEIRYLAADERIRAESALLGELLVPQLVRVLEYVEDGRDAAVVTEPADGLALPAVLAETGPLAPEAALHVLKDSLLGLAAAHGAGVVHRDFRAAEVLVGEDGVCRVGGFGLVADEGADAAADVLAATVVFFQCLAGRDTPVSLTAAPEVLRPLVVRGLAENPLARPAAGRFAELLDDVAGQAYGDDWEQRGVAGLVAVTKPRRSLRKPLLAAGGVAVLVAAAGVVAFVWSGDDAAPEPERPAVQAAVPVAPGGGTSMGRMVFTVAPTAKVVGAAKAAQANNRRTMEVRLTVTPAKVHPGNTVTVRMTDRRTDRSGCPPVGKRVQWVVGDGLPPAAVWLYPPSTPLPMAAGRKIGATVQAGEPKTAPLRPCGHVTVRTSSYTFKVPEGLARGTYGLSTLHPPRVTRLRGAKDVPVAQARATRQGRLPMLTVQ
ncbi:protein kinase domain-containing protein [Spirillospora sp. NBC_01491]|uniref:protein kinase domain-containing protein n=1 Tax=Spirillospora sp. NBC_01491 TaxID=2976007 RepID=UPI002E2EB32D|nr:protein kinase [Spirillospora sp. NBC_01491]